MLAAAQRMTRGQYQRREVRRTLVAQYEVRYEIADDEIIILCRWHTRELR
jgi:hypothetical protein